MAWWNRVPGVKQVVSGVNRLNRRLRGTGRPQPEPQPRPRPQTPMGMWSAQPPPAQRPVWPTAPQPTDYGMWADVEPDVPPDYEPVYDDRLLYDDRYREVRDNTVIMYDQNLQPIEYDKETGEYVAFSGPEWYSQTFLPQEVLIAKYGIDNIDILNALKSGGYITDEDWQAWREVYGGMFH